MGYQVASEVTPSEVYVEDNGQRLKKYITRHTVLFGEEKRIGQKGHIAESQPRGGSSVMNYYGDVYWAGVIGPG